MATVNPSEAASTKARATPPSREDTREAKVVTVPTEGKTTRKGQKAKNLRMENPRVENPRVENLRASPRKVDTAGTVTTVQDSVILVVTATIPKGIMVLASMILEAETINKQSIIECDGK